MTPPKCIACQCNAVLKPPPEPAGYALIGILYQRLGQTNLCARHQAILESSFNQVEKDLSNLLQGRNN